MDFVVRDGVIRYEVSDKDRGLGRQRGPGVTKTVFISYPASFLSWTWTWHLCEPEDHVGVIDEYVLTATEIQFEGDASR